MATMSATMKQFTKGLKTTFEPMQTSLANIEQSLVIQAQEKSREEEVEAKRLEKKKLDEETKQTSWLKKLFGKKDEKGEGGGFFTRHWRKILFALGALLLFLPKQWIKNLFSMKWWEENGLLIGGAIGAGIIAYLLGPGIWAGVAGVFGLSLLAWMKRKGGGVPVPGVQPPVGKPTQSGSAWWKSGQQGPLGPKGQVQPGRMSLLKEAAKIRLASLAKHIPKVARIGTALRAGATMVPVILAGGEVVAVAAVGAGLVYGAKKFWDHEQKFMKDMKARKLKESALLSIPKQSMYDSGKGKITIGGQKVRSSKYIDDFFQWRTEQESKKKLDARLDAEESRLAKERDDLIKEVKATDPDKQPEKYATLVKRVDALAAANARLEKNRSMAKRINALGTPSNVKPQTMKFQTWPNVSWSKNITSSNPKNLTADTTAKLGILANLLGGLNITSGRRTKAEQAKAMIEQSTFTMSKKWIKKAKITDAEMKSPPKSQAREDMVKRLQGLGYSSWHQHGNAIDFSYPHPYSKNNFNELADKIDSVFPGAKDRMIAEDDHIHLRFSDKNDPMESNRLMQNLMGENNDLTRNLGIGGSGGGVVTQVNAPTNIKTGDQTTLTTSNNAQMNWDRLTQLGSLG